MAAAVCTQAPSIAADNQGISPSTGTDMGPSSAAKAYAQISVETGVHAADPVRLVLMLYDGALASIADADRHMAAGKIADKGQAISRAIAIIDGGLRVSLDTSRGGAIAAQLYELYDYMDDGCCSRVCATIPPVSPKSRNCCASCAAPGPSSPPAGRAGRSAGQLHHLIHRKPGGRMNMNQQQLILSHYESLAHVSQLMLQAAWRNDWDTLIDAEACCASLIEGLKAAGDPAQVLDAEGRKRKHASSAACSPTTPRSAT